jgi:hypothetical protein
LTVPVPAARTFAATLTPLATLRRLRDGDAVGRRRNRKIKLRRNAQKRRDNGGQRSKSIFPQHNNNPRDNNRVSFLKESRKEKRRKGDATA